MSVRMVLAGVLTLVAGFVAGSLVMQARLDSLLAGAAAQRDDALQQLQGAIDAKEAAELHARTLEARNQTLTDEATILQTRAEAQRTQSAMAAVDPQGAMTDNTPATPTGVDGALEPRDRGDRDDRDRRGRGPWGRGDEELSEEQRAERQQRWQAFREQMQAQRESFFQTQLDASPSRESQDRVKAIWEYSDYMRELRDAMRQAETDEERQALRQSMEETGQIVRDLTRDQQDFMVRELAAQHGITSKGDQDAFVSAVRDLQSNPLFQGYGGRGGRGRGPGSGGFGPPR